ncbi:MAG: DinB family protein [Thermomicrobiales bacterium]|nr:DinB family protein [Thermomicrobiales bacterium]
MSHHHSDAIPTRAELMERIEAAWADLDQALIDLDGHQISLAPAPGEWSIKDHLAHLATWTVSAAALLSGKSRPEAMGVDGSVWASADEDEINAQIERIWSERAPADVLAALRTAQAQLRELIGAMSDDDLARAYSHFQPDATPYVAAPVVGWIAGNTFEHVAMHLPALHAIRERVT